VTSWVNASGNIVPELEGACRKLLLEFVIHNSTPVSFWSAPVRIYGMQWDGTWQTTRVKLRHVTSFAVDSATPWSWGRAAGGAGNGRSISDSSSLLVAGWENVNAGMTVSPDGLPTYYYYKCTGVSIRALNNNRTTIVSASVLIVIWRREQRCLQYCMCDLHFVWWSWQRVADKFTSKAFRNLPHCSDARYSSMVSLHCALAKLWHSVL